MRTETHYSVLGVPENATHPEIKAAYRNLLKRIHPDTVSNLSPDVRSLAGEATQQIVQAYSVLSDDILRRQYDRQLAERRLKSVPPRPAVLRSARRRHRRKARHSSFRVWMLQHPFLVLGYVFLTLMILAFLCVLAMAVIDYYGSTGDDSGRLCQPDSRFPGAGWLKPATEDSRNYIGEARLLFVSDFAILGSPRTLAC